MTLADPYPPELRALVRRSVGRTLRALSAGAPTLAEHAEAWMRRLAGGLEPAAYFLHPEAFPMLLLPWWLEAAIRGAPERRFQADVVHSSINGYYAVRLIDDLMDGERTPPPGLLPVLTLFHGEFEETYFRHFPHAHPFWDACRAASLASAELASRDANPGDVDRRRFLDVSARKTAGARIPIAAVCHHAGRPDLMGPWFELVERLGRWHQMLNDVRGWIRDLDAGRPTYFLSRGREVVGEAGSLDEWALGQGLAWAEVELGRWMREAIEAAAPLGSPPLIEYLQGRHESLTAELRSLAAGRAALERLAASLR